MHRPFHPTARRARRLHAEGHPPRPALGRRRPGPLAPAPMRPLQVVPLLLLALGTAPALRAQHRPAPLPERLHPAAPLAAFPGLQMDQEPPGPEISGGRYAAMVVGGTLGSALGLLSGLVGAGAVAVLSGCLDCGGSDVPFYLLGAAGSTLGTALVVTGAAEDPVSTGFWRTTLELARRPLFRPALLGAAAGVAAGGGLALLVDSVAPSDQPYAMVAYNVGQAAASVAAVRIAVGARP